MASPLLASLKQQIQNLDAALIERKDNFADYDTSDFIRATGFVVLASALLEDFVEKRCNEIAAEGIARLSRQQPTATGRALSMWYIVRRPKSHLEIPIHDHDLPALAATKGAEALVAYKQSVSKSHGISANDFLGLTVPLGLREHAMPSSLGPQLEALASRRDVAVHTRAPRAQQLRDPAIERQAVDAIVKDLETVDDHLEFTLNNWPI